MCSICKQLDCPPRCPNYTPMSCIYNCSICGEGIYPGDEYVENNNYKYAHLDCLDGMTTKNLLSWMDMDYKICEDGYYD